MYDNGCTSNASNGVYTKTTRGTEEVYMFYYFFATYGCRMSGNGNGNEQPKAKDSVTVTGNSSLLKTTLIYPNPSNGIVTINSPYPIENIKLIDIAGRVLKECKINAYAQKLDLSGMPKGMYTVLVITKNKRESLKLLLQ